MNTLNFHDPKTNDDYLDIATVLCRHPGVVAPVEGRGVFVEVANILLCPANACHAVLVLLQAWGDPRGVVVKGEGAVAGEDDTIFNVRIDGTPYKIRASAIPTLFTLLLPLVPLRLYPSFPLHWPQWQAAEHHWRRAGRERNFVKMYPNEGSSFGFWSGGMTKTIFVTLSASSAILLANATNPSDFFEFVESDPHAKTTRTQGQSND